jgi:cytochrome c5
MRFGITISLAFILFLSSAFVSAQSAAPQASSQQEEKKDDLPDGDGKKILLEACGECHEYKQVTKFAGTYDRTEWADLVKSMIVYGAMLTADQETTLVDYLDEHFGKK